MSLFPSSVLNTAGGQISGYVNSIQSFSITIANGNTSATATISAVGANAYIVYGGTTNTRSTADGAADSAKLVLTNSTTVTASINSTGNDSQTVTGYVIDPKASLVTGVQAGTITISAGTSNTATITSVNTSLSVVYYLGQTATDTTGGMLANDVLVRLDLTDATTVTATLNTSGTATVSYVVVTYAAAAIQSIQPFSVTKSSGTSNTQAITGVTTSNSIIAWGGLTTTSVNLTRANAWVTLTDSTTLTFTSVVGSAYTINLTVVEFKTGVLKSIQRGSIAISAGTSNTATITSVDTTKAGAAYLGSTTSDTAASGGLAGRKVTLTNATTVTGTVGSSGSPTIGYQVAEYN